MKNKIYNLVKNFFLEWILFSILFGVGFGIYIRNLRIVIIPSFFAGGAFAFVCTSISIIMLFRMEKLKKKFFQDDRFLFSDLANHILKGESVGGWLFLSERELCFKSHKCNWGVHELKISFSDIRTVGKGKIFRSICVQLKNGTTEYFIVNNRKKVILIMNELLKRI